MNEKHATLRFAGVFADGDVTHARAVILGGTGGACAGAGFVLDMGAAGRVTGKTVLGLESQGTAEYAALLAGLRMAYLSRVTHLVVECASAPIIHEMRTGTVPTARPVALHTLCVAHACRFPYIEFRQGSLYDSNAAIHQADVAARCGRDSLDGFEPGIDERFFLAPALLPPPDGPRYRAARQDSQMADDTKK